MNSSSRDTTNYLEILKQYKLYETLGTGGFGKVKRAVHVITNEQVAIKIMDKKSLGKDLPRIYSEIQALKKLHHQYISRLYQVIETDTKIFIVMEYCPGGELFDYIVDRNRLPESDARKYFRQIISGLGYIHSMGYCHRDLKPENILLTEGGNSIKIIDFGLCARTSHEDTQETAFLKSACGSPAYAAPELIDGKAYEGDKADIWSSGIILYALLVGQLPFDIADSNDYKALYAKIKSGKYVIPKYLSGNACDYISKILTLNPKERIPYETMCDHDWIKNVSKSKAGNVGSYRKVDYKTSIKPTTLCLQTIRSISSLIEIGVDILKNHLNNWSTFDEIRAYYLLLHKAGSARGISRPIVIRALLKDSIRNLASQNKENVAISTPLRARRQALKAKSQRETVFDRVIVPQSPVKKLSPLPTWEMTPIDTSNRTHGFYSSTSDMEHILSEDESMSFTPNPIIPVSKTPIKLQLIEEMENLRINRHREMYTPTAGTPKMNRKAVLFATPQPIPPQYARKLKLTNSTRKYPQTDQVVRRRAPPRRSRTPPTTWLSPSKPETPMPVLVEVSPRKGRPTKDNFMVYKNQGAFRRSQSGGPKTESPKAVVPLTPIGKLYSDTNNSGLVSSMERGLYKMKKIFPTSSKKTVKEYSGDKKIKFEKTMANMSHLSFQSATWLLEQITCSISKREYINYRVKRFTIRCQIHGDGIGSISSSRKNSESSAIIHLDFEIEVVRLSKTIIEQARHIQLMTDKADTSDKEPVSGVRRRRLKGDTFLYKEITSSILSEIDQS